MKQLFLAIVLLCLGNVGMAQVRGNGNIITKRFPIPSIEEVTVNINGNLTIDASSSDNYLEITADENLMTLLTPELNGSVLELAQQKWVEATQEIQYKIASSQLKVIKNDSWTDVSVSGLDQASIRYQSLVGAKATLEGKVTEFRLGMESGTVDASALEAENAIVDIWDRAKATVNVSGKLSATVSNDGKLIYASEPKHITKKISSGGEVLSTAKAKEAISSQAVNTRYIRFKIKSKDTQVIQAYVKGPKPNGGYFSYGLPIRPFMPRKENWTIGTKLYSVNEKGEKKLIYTVKAADEGKVIIVSKR